MKKSALFLVVLIGILGNANVIATTNGYTTGAELTKADFDLIAGVIDQNGLFVATTIGTFSAGAAALCWLKGKWKGNEADVKNAAKKGASVGVGICNRSGVDAQS